MKKNPTCLRFSRSWICWLTHASRTCLPLLGLLWVTMAFNASGQTLQLSYQFNDALPSVTSTDLVVGAVVTITNHSLVAADLHGTNGTGPGNSGQTLDFTTDDGANTANTVSGSASTAVASDWNDSKINLGTVSAFTVTFWLKNAAVFGSGDSPLLFELGAGSNAKSAFALNGANTIGFAENTSGNPEFWAGSKTCPNPVASGSLTANVWYFYALTYDGSNYRVYVGTESNTVALVNTISAASQTLAFGNSGTVIFGNRGSDNSRNFPGWLAHFQFYNGSASQNFVEGIREANLPLVVGATSFSPASPVFVGTPVTLSATIADGTAPYTYDWQVSTDGGVSYSDLPSGNGNATYNLDTTGQAGTTSYYRLIVTDSETVPVVVTNASAALYVSSTPLPPAVTADTVITPASILLGGSATMTATINGTAPVAYQWQFSATNDGTGTVNITGATNETYTITNAQYANTGYYRLSAVNSSGSTNSSFASLTVQVPVTISIGTAGGSAPIVGPYDIAQLSSQGDTKFPGANALNYYDNNGAKPGQTFTTGNSANGYSLAALYYLCGGPVVSDGSHSAGTVYTLRLYSVSGTAATLLSTYTNQNASAAIANNSWAEWTGLTNVLAPNTTYAYSVSSGAAYMHLGNASNTPAFYNGGLGLFPTASGTITFATPADTSDATFLVNLVPAGYPDVQNVAISPVSSSTSPVYGGTPISLSAQAIGNGPLVYDWQTDNGSGGATWTDLPNGNANPYSLNTTTLPSGTYQYRVVVQNDLSSSTSSVVQLYLTAASAPVVTTNTAIVPSGVFVGGSAVMSAAFTGTPQISYQWMFDNGGGPVPISGATNKTYTLANAQLTNAGAYYLQASNGIAPYTSQSAPVQFAVATAPQANNASVIISDIGNLPPSVGTNDIAQVQISSPITYGPTAIPGLNYYVNNSTPPGQIFTTSNNPPDAQGYPLTTIDVQEELGTAATGGTNSQSYTLDIYQVEGSNAVLITSYTTANQLGITEGDWIQFNGLTNFLQPNSTYAFSVHNNGTGYWKLSNDENPFDPNDPANDLYLGGQVACLPASGIGAISYSTDPTIDASFLVGLTPQAAPVLSQDTRITPATAVAGSNVVISAYFGGASPMYFQWQFTDKNGVGPTPIAGATNMTYVIPVAHLTDTGTYSLLAWNSLGTNSSTPASLSVVPMILNQDTVITPSSAYVNANIPITMTASFAGAGITYQWQFWDTNGVGPVNVPGATNSTYVISNFVASAAGTYSLLASNNPDGTTSTLASTPASLSVLSVPTDLLINYAYTYGTLYNGPGVIASTSGGTYWNQLKGANGTGAVSATTLAPDGFTQLGINLSVGDTYQSANNATLGLFTYYELLQSTGVNEPITFSGLPQGVYNLVIYSVDGAYNNAHSTFVFGNQTNTANANNSSAFVLNNNYVVFTNVLATNGLINGYWFFPGNHEGAFNGAQLQLAYSLANPRLFISSQPSGTSVPVGFPANLSVAAQGPGTDGLPGPLFYQWWTTNGVTGAPITGATNSVYIPNTALPGTNGYFVVITNLTGLITNSAAATVAVYQPDTLSWRGTVSDVWDNSSLNWSNISQQVDGVAFQTNDEAVFDDTAASFVVSNSMVEMPGSVAFNNNANNYLLMGAGSLSGNMSLTKNGTATLTISNFNNYTGGTMVNDGTLTLAVGGGNSAVIDSLNINPGASVVLSASDALGYNAGTCLTNVTIDGGVLTNATGGNEGYNTAFNLMGGNIASSGGAYNLNGSGAAINSLATNVISTISAPLALRASGLVIATTQGSVPGGVDLNISGVISGGANSITKAGSGTLELSATNTYTGTTTVSGGTLLVDGVVPGAITANAGTVGGTGTIGGLFTVNAGATLSPGSNGAGVLTVNNLTLNSGATTTFTVNGATSTNAVVNATGSIGYGGVLNIVATGPFTVGQSFQLFSGAGAVSSSSFTSIQGNPGDGKQFSFANGVLTVMSAGVSNPVITGFKLSGNTLIISGTNGAANAQFILLGTTNLALPINQWTPVMTNSFNGNGNFNLSTNIIDPSQPQEFYILMQ